MLSVVITIMGEWLGEGRREGRIERDSIGMGRRLGEGVLRGNEGMGWGRGLGRGWGRGWVTDEGVGEGIEKIWRGGKRVDGGGVEPGISGK